MNYVSTPLVCVFSFLFCLGPGIKECNQSLLRKRVLNENKPNKPFVFNCHDENGLNEMVELVYLGVVGSKNRYKIVASTWIHGESHRATNRILIFDEYDKLLGNYYVTSVSELPERIESRKLVFSNTTDVDCDKTVVSKVSFDEGIPDEIFVRCDNNSGDFFSFSHEE